jgi:hypothetical protein
LVCIAVLCSSQYPRLVTPIRLMDHAGMGEMDASHPVSEAPPEKVDAPRGINPL